MAISMQKTRSLCTDSELNLIKWSSPKQIKTLTPAKLRQKLDRARKLRDKFKDLSRKQAGEARGKRKPTGTRPAKGNERTVEKRELFEEVITRFETALTKAEASAMKADAAKAKKKAASQKPNAGKKKATGKKTVVNKKKTASKSAKVSLPKVAGVGGTGLRAPSLSGRSSSSPLAGLGTSAAMQQSRETRRKESSRSSKGDREQNRFARTSQEKIQGHVSASTRRSQAKRDSKG